MRRRATAFTISLAALVLLTVVSVGGAATDTKTLTINAVVTGRAKLTLGVSAINFPAHDPDTTPSIPANENPVTVRAQVLTGSTSTSTLTVLANGDLISGAETITISDVTWTASGTGYVAGTMSKTVQVPAGSWTGPGDELGYFNYFLTIHWDHAGGNYTQTAVYTLIVP